MLNNYLKVALRQLLKNKTFSFINIIGLSVGIACCVLLALYIQDEFSFEKGFAHHQRIYRMYTSFIKDGHEETFPRTSPPIAIDLKEELSEIETATRAVSPPEVEQHIVRYGDKIFYEKTGLLVDSTFFDVFSYLLKEGDGKTALDAPSTVVISEKLSAKIFGEKSPLDELLIINSGRSVDTFRVTGVVEKMANQSHLDADFYMCMNSKGWGKWIQEQHTWAWNNFMGSYLKLREDVDPKSIEEKLPGLMEKYAGKDLKNAGVQKKLFLQPIDDIRLYSDFTDGFMETGSGGIKYVYILSLIGAFILLIACINFMNLTTAKATQRAGEVGIRKSLGAFRSNLIKQFLGETGAIVFFSLLLAGLLVGLGLPLINLLVQKQLSINSSNILFLLGAMLGVGMVTGLLAGSYPAFILSSYRPAIVLRNKNLSGNSSHWLRRGLVIFQFIIAIALISSIVIVQQQLNFIQHKPLGFSAEKVIVVPMRTRDASSAFLQLKNAFKELVGVREVTGSTSLPSMAVFRDFSLYPEGSTMDKAVLHRMLNVDENYFNVMGIKLVAGRDFVSEKDTFSFHSSNNKLIVNRESLRVFNIDLEDAIGTNLMTEWEGKLRNHEIIGVVEDYHQFSLHQPIVPLQFFLPADRKAYLFLTASIDGSSLDKVVSQMKEAWNKIVPNTPFESEFLTDIVHQQYETDSRISTILTVSTALAILLSCLGLYGLSIFIAQGKVKEIGIRKVLGASVINIVGMLSVNFILLVMIAFVITVPLAYYAMDKWLSGFAYKIELGSMSFLLAGTIALLVAWITVGFESVKVAIGNPVKALRSE